MIIANFFLHFFFPHFGWSISLNAKFSYFEFLPFCEFVEGLPAKGEGAVGPVLHKSGSLCGFSRVSTRSLLVGI